MAEPPKQDKKDKKNRRDKKRKFQEKKESKKTPATNNNAINAFKKDLKKRRNINKVTCFNYNKKSHYASDYTKPPNNKY